MSFGSMLLAALGIGLLIFLHELGHFLAARLAGVRVEVFSLGFGPRLGGVDWRGTDFRLSLVPFGGYVMVAGQDPSDRRYPASQCLWAKGLGQRALFWSGGVVMNLVFALLAFPVVFRLGVDFTAPVIGDVMRGSAAWEARLQRDDRIVSIAGKQVYSFENLMVEVALAGGRPVPLVVRGHDGGERTVSVLPQWNANDGRFELGIGDSSRPTPPTLIVTKDGAAAAAGLRDGDLVLAIDGKEPRPENLAEIAATIGGERPFDLDVQRAGTRQSARVTPAVAKAEAPLRIGVTLLARQVRAVRQGSPFVEQLGIRRGDVVLAVDDAPFLSGDLAVARTGPPTLRVHVRRDGQLRLLELPASAAERAAFADDVALQAHDKLLLAPDSQGAAAAAGLLAGDWVLAVDGSPMRTFEDLRRAVGSAAEKPIALTVCSPRAAGSGPFAADAATQDLAFAAPRELTITPRRQALFDSGLDLRFEKLTEEVRAESTTEALRLGMLLSLDMLKQLYVTMKRMVTGDVGAKNLGGIIRISQVSYQAAQRGASWFLYLLAMLSLNLGFVNLLPVPILDGGHLMFLLIEKVKGSPVSSRVFGYSQVIGLVFVLMLVLFVTYNDILQLL